MELEFSKDIFQSLEGQEQGVESADAGPRHVYSNEEHGNVQAFVTEKQYAEAYKNFKEEFEDEIDKIIEFVKKLNKKSRVSGGAPLLSYKQEEAIVEAFEKFKERLFTFDEKGISVAYPHESMDIVYANGKSTLITIRGLLEDERMPAATCAKVLNALGEKLLVCSGGVTEAMYEAFGALKANIQGLRGVAAQGLEELAKQVTLEFVRRRHQNDANYFPAMEVHFVRYYLNELAAPDSAAEPYDWLDEPFPWPIRPDPDYGTEEATGVMKEDLTDCYAVLRERLRPSLVLRHIAEQYFTEIKESAMAAADKGLWERASTAVGQLQAQYGEMPVACVVTFDDLGEADWRPKPTLIVLEMQKRLAQRNLLIGAEPNILVRSTSAEEGEPPQDLMQWEKLFWVREWSRAPTETMNPDKNSDPVPLSAAHLHLFSPGDVEASVAEDGEEEAARILKEVALEAIEGADMAQLMNIPDAWFPFIPLAEMLQALPPGDPLRRADKAQWAAFFRKAIDAGVGIEQENTKENSEGQTPLLAVAEQGLADAFLALAEAGAEMRVEDNRGWNPLLTWIAKGGGNIVGERRAALFEEALAKCAPLLEHESVFGQTPLLAAAEDRLLDAFETLIDMGGNPHARSLGGENALTLLLEKAPDDSMSVERWDALLRKVIAREGNIDEPNAAGHTPLGIAAERGMINAFEAFLMQGANPNAKTSEDLTALMWMMEKARGDMDAKRWAALFEKAVASGANIEEENPMGETLLLQAADRGMANAFTALLNMGANPTVRNADGQNALMVLMDKISGDMDADRWRGLFNKAKDGGIDLDASYWGDTLLTQAAAKGMFNAFTALIEAGADLRVREVEAQSGRRPVLARLMAEVSEDVDAKRWADLFQKAIAKDAERQEARGQQRIPLLEEKDDFDQTLLMAAAKVGRVDLFMTLVDAGANLAVVDDHGEIPLTLLVKEASLHVDAEQWAAVIKKAKDHGADLELTNKIGRTVLVEAALAGQIDAFVALEEAGANLMAGDAEACALLHLIAHAPRDLEKERWAAWIRKAKDSGLDMEETNWPGNTLLVQAAIRALPNAVMALAEEGASLLARTFEDVDAFRVLMRSGSRDLETEQWAALFDKAIDSGFDIEDARAGSTLLVEAAFQNLPNMYTVLADKGANLLTTSENALVWWLDQGRDDMAAAYVERVRGDDAYAARTPEFLDVIGHARVFALDKDCNCPKALRAMDEFLIKAMREDSLTRERFSAIVTECAPKRRAVLTEGDPDVIEADNAFLVEAMNNHGLTPREFSQMVVIGCFGVRGDLGKQRSTPGVELDNKLLIMAMKAGWITEEAFDHMARLRGEALAKGRAPEVEAYDRLLIAAMDEGCLAEAAVAQILAATDDSGIPYRSHAIDNGDPKTVRVDNKALIHAMKIDLMRSETFEALVQNNALRIPRYGEQANLEVFEAIDELIVEGAKNGWLSAETIKELILRPNPWSNSTRHAAFTSNDAKGLRVSNDLLLQVGKHLDKAVFMEIAAAEAGVQGRSMALLLDCAEAVEADNEFLLEARRRGMLTDKELKALLYSPDIAQPVWGQHGLNGLLAHGEAVLRAYGEGWLTEEDIKELEPKPDWLKKNLPQDFEEAEHRRAYSASLDMEDSDSASYSSGRASPSPQAPERGWEEVSAVSATGGDASPPLLTPPEQGEIAREMEAHGLAPLTIEAEGRTRQVTLHNDCALQVLFRMDRDLLEAYHDRHDNGHAWKEALSTLRDQMRQSVVYLSDISEADISSDALKKLIQARKLDIREDGLILHQPIPQEDRKPFDAGVETALAEGYKSGTSFALVVGYQAPASIDRGDMRGLPEQMNMGGHIIRGGHFVTLTPACHPEDNLGQLPANDLDQQFWLLSDSIGSKQLTVTTQQILDSLDEKQYELIGARDASVRFQHLAGPSLARHLEVAPGPSTQTPSPAEEGRSESDDELFQSHVEQFERRVIADIVRLAPAFAIDVSVLEAEVNETFKSTIPAIVPDAISEGGKLAAGVINTLAVGDRDGALAAMLGVMDANRSIVVDEKTFPVLADYLAEQQSWREHMKDAHRGAFEKRCNRARREHVALTMRKEDVRQTEEDVQKNVIADLTQALINARVRLNQCGEKDYELLLDIADHRLPRLPETFFLQVEFLPIEKVYCLKVELKGDSGRKAFLALTVDELRNSFAKKLESVRVGDRFEARIVQDVCLLKEGDAPKVKNQTRL
jgi:uncharacterized protein